MSEITTSVNETSTPTPIIYYKATPGSSGSTNAWPILYVVIIGIALMVIGIVTAVIAYVCKKNIKAQMSESTENDKNFEQFTRPILEE